MQVSNLNRKMKAMQSTQDEMVNILMGIQEYLRGDTRRIGLNTKLTFVPKALDKPAEEDPDV